MSNHTPGPLEVVDLDNGEFNVVTSDGYIVCTCFDGAQHNAEANARLIAAAPDMLEALIEIFKGFENNWCLDWTKYQKIIERATGKSIEEASNK